ncbi:hypothetical protein MJP40_23735, partial [Escherichia coli]|nr:hypothetical protein [Escherichia coli]
GSLFACRESHFSAYLTLWFPLLIWWTPLCLICQILTRRFRLYAYGAVNAILITKLSWIPIYNSGPGFAKMIFACAIFIVVAYITFNFIEKPFIKLGRKVCNKIASV